MKIPPARIDNFIEKPPAGIKGFLFYGPDYGLAAELSTKLCTHFLASSPAILKELDYTLVKQTPVELADCFKSQSLWGEKLIVVMKQVTATLPALLQQVILSAKEAEGYMVLVAGELPPASSTRQLFENTEFLAAIACYKDEAATLKKIIIDHLHQARVHIEADALKFLESQLTGDRMMVRNELEKLVLYAGPSQRVTLKDAEMCLGENLDVSLDEATLALASLSTAKAIGHLKRLWEEETSPITVIRSFSRYFSRLLHVKSLMEEGMPEAQAMAQLKPPVFFKQVGLFKQHLQHWSSARLAKVLHRLLELEVECKKTGTNGLLLCERLCLEVTNNHF